jgi:hypothetical protein
MNEANKLDGLDGSLGTEGRIEVLAEEKQAPRLTL